MPRGLRIGYGGSPNFRLNLNPIPYFYNVQTGKLTSSSAGNGASISAGRFTLNQSGGGFGTKSTATPFFWNDFESQSIGDTAIVCGLSSLGGDGTMPVVANDRAANGTKSLKVIYPADGLGSKFPRIGCNFSGAGASSQAIYCFTSLYWDCTTGSCNFPILKLGRAGANPSYSGQPQFHETIRPDTTGTVGSEDMGYTTPGRGSFYGDPHNGVIAKPLNWRVFYSLEYIFKLSTPGSTNGVFQVLVNGVDNVGGRIYDAGGTLQTGSNAYCANNDSGSTANIDWGISVFDGNDTYGGANAFALWADNMFVDNTLIRCIATNSNVYAASTKIMPMYADTWGNTQVAGPFHAGPFVSGDTIWFWTFDASNSVTFLSSTTVP